MNKLDDFFKSKLDNDQIADDGWNIPSDELWEAAKIHFPKKKEKKKAVIFWKLTSIFALALVIYAIYNVKLTDDRIVANDSHSLQNLPQHETKKILNYSNAVTSSTDENELPIENAAKTENLASNRIKANGNTQESIISIEINPNIQKSNIGNSTIKNLKSSLFGGSVLKSQESEGAIDLIFQNSSSILERNDKLTNSKEVDKKTNSAIVDTVRPIDNRMTSILSPLPVMSAIMSLSDEQMPIMINQEVIPKKRSYYPKREFGISHLALFANISDGIVLEGDNVIFDFRVNSYRNLNLNYRRWVSRSWSITTGLYASKAKFNIDIDALVTVEENDVMQTVNIEGGQLSPRSDGTGDDYKVELLQGFTVENQEMLTMRANLDLRLKALQVPFYITKHWYPGRVEFSIGGGATVEYIEEHQTLNSLLLYRDDVQISKAIVPEDSDDRYFSYSLYTQFGLRYKLTPQINLSLHTRISILDPIYSGFDLGVNYRWNR